MQENKKESQLKFLLTRVSIFAVLTFCAVNTQAKQSLVCQGAALLHHNESCKRSIDFSLIVDTAKLQISDEVCLRSMHFDKMSKDKDDDLKLEYSYRYSDPVTKKKMLEDFNLNKLTGEFGLGVTDLDAMRMDKLSVGGFCKRAKNVID